MQFIYVACSCFILFFSTLISAQEGNYAEQIQKHLSDFSDGDYTYEQRVTQGSQAWLLTLTRTEISEKKGEEEVFSYTFNAALIDKNLLSIKSDKNSIQVFLKTGKEPFIKEQEDGEEKGYTNQLGILVPDIDAARALKKTLEKVVSAAAQTWQAENSVPEDFEGLLQYLRINLKEVAWDDERQEQAMTPSEIFPDRIVITSETFEEKGSEGKISYDFSIGDLEPKGLKPEVKKEAIVLDLKTKGGTNLIKTTDEEDEVKFTDKLTLYFGSPEAAILYTEAVEKAAPLGADRIQSRLTPPTDLVAARVEFKQLIEKALYKGDRVTQAIRFEGVNTTLTRTIFDSKGGEEKELFLFGLADLEKKIKTDFGSTQGSIEVKTRNKEDYVYVEESGEQKNYTDEVVFYSDEVEYLRRMEILLPYLIDNASEEVELLTLETLLGILSKIDTEDFAQNTELDESGEQCKIKVSQTEKGRKTDETVSTLNLDDLNAESVELKISGKEINVVAETQGKDKIIQIYENGKDLEYSDEIELRVADIVSAKQIKITLQNLINLCRR